MLDSLRSLLGAHLALARAELAAIAREIGAIVGGLALALLLGIVGVAAALVLALLGLSSLLLGSPLFGAALLPLGSLLAAALLATGVLRIEGRRRALSLAGLSGLALSFALVAGLSAEPGSAIGWGLLLTAFNGTLRLGARLGQFDAARLRERLYPHATITEFERTLETADELIGGRR
jgi:hypothetical protein